MRGARLVVGIGGLAQLGERGEPVYRCERTVEVAQLAIEIVARSGVGEQEIPCPVALRDFGGALKLALEVVREACFRCLQRYGLRQGARPCLLYTSPSP